MSTWAQRAKAHFLQKGQNSTTETTESPLLTVLTVHFGRSCKKHGFQNQTESAATDPRPTPPMVQAAPPTDSASGEVIDIGTLRPPGLSPALLAASLALDTQIHAVRLFDNSDENPDRWCYPEGEAMTGAEIDTFTVRLARFTDKGVRQMDAESLADKLVTRDREQDDRGACLECTHLGGYGATSWRCGNWQAAGVAHRAREAQLPVDLVQRLQRCDGYASLKATP